MLQDIKKTKRLRNEMPFKCWDKCLKKQMDQRICKTVNGRLNQYYFLEIVA